MKPTILFDSVIPLTLKTVESFETRIKPPIIIVRQATGTITVIVKEFIDTTAAEEIAKKLHHLLGPYSPGSNSVILSASDLIDPDEILSSRDKIRLDCGLEAFIVDRLLTNQDWLRDCNWKPPVPIAVAFSIKGGVGRSLALTAFARHLSKMGKKVSIVDLDLEAPGLGVLLATDDGTKYGVTDWLVESLVDNAPAILTDDFWFRVPSLSVGSGAVFCIPAWGSETKEYIAKVGRAYLTSFSSDGHESINLGNRLQLLMQSIAHSELSPDVILIDSRAGLHDLGAAAVTQLGAEVMFFARDEMQSWKSYLKLFEHLAKSKQVAWGKQSDDLRSRLKMVAAQIGPTEEALRHSVQASYDIWQRIYDEESGTVTSDVSYSMYDETAPHYPTPIYFSDSLRGFAGWGMGETIREEIINIAFGEFCSTYFSRLGFGGEQ